jgi:hypothetical protein
MDGIFGHTSFRNEITWQRHESHNTASGYGNIADTILYYAPRHGATWNSQYHSHGKALLKRFRYKDVRGRYKTG